MPEPIDLSEFPEWRKLVDAHPGYRRLWLKGEFPPLNDSMLRSLQEKSARRVQSIPRLGVGTELKALLHKVGINPVGNCACESRARVMDEKGVEWCEEHLELIIDWLQEEAKRRCLPFVRVAGKLLVKRAIRNARKKEREKELVRLP